jgi:uncharacterized protein (TIGR02466 family)
MRAGHNVPQLARRDDAVPPNVVSRKSPRVILERQSVGVYELFPTIVLSYLWPNSDELNLELRSLILRKEKESEGIQTSNAGGWHSEKHFQDWNSECVRVLCSRMILLCQEIVSRVVGTTERTSFENWSVEAWANVNRFGHYNKLHHHCRNLNLWSGVYYVDVGDHERTSESARIIFADQNRVEVRDRPELAVRFAVRPEPSLMLLFPSSLAHRVETYNGGSERITVAFNLRHELFTTLNYEIEKKKAQKSAQGKPADGIK